MITRHDEILAVDQTLQAVETLWAPKHPDWASERFYAREPLPLVNFFAGMKIIGEPAGRTFLDAGCGVGTKLHLARMLGWDYLSGFDIYIPYLKAAIQLCNWADIWKQDAFDCAIYNQYDVVYSYRLCVNDEDQKNLENLIVSRMKPGAIAFFPQGLTKPGEELGVDVWRIE